MMSQTPMKKSDSGPYDINYCCNLPIAIFLNLEKGLLSADSIPQGHFHWI